MINWVVVPNPFLPPVTTLGTIGPFVVAPSVQIVGIQPTPPNWAAGEYGIEWLGSVMPTSTLLNQVTTGYGVSIGLSGVVSWAVTPFVPPVLVGFVLSTNPSSTQPTTWYPTTQAIINGKTAVSLFVGAQGGFRPTLGTKWWVWFSLNGGLIQVGQLLSV